MIYFISDLHLGHNRDFVYGARGFSSCDEHNEQIIKRWNNTVSAEDDVYVLGDLILGDNDKGIANLSMLNGKLHIVYGNHDTATRQELYKTLPNVVEICGYATVIKYKGYHFYLSHYPTLTDNYDENKSLKTRIINLCGHTHTTDKFNDMHKGLIYHVDADAHNCTPVSAESVLEDIKNNI